MEETLIKALLDYVGNQLPGFLSLIIVLIVVVINLFIKYKSEHRQQIAAESADEDTFQKRLMDNNKMYQDEIKLLKEEVRTIEAHRRQDVEYYDELHKELRAKVEELEKELAAVRRENFVIKERNFILEHLLNEADSTKSRLINRIEELEKDKQLLEEYYKLEYEKFLAEKVRLEAIQSELERELQKYREIYSGGNV